MWWWWRRTCPKHRAASAGPVVVLMVVVVVVVVVGDTWQHRDVGVGLTRGGGDGGNGGDGECGRHPSAALSDSQPAALGKGSAGSGPDAPSRGPAAAPGLAAGVPVPVPAVRVSALGEQPPARSSCDSHLGSARSSRGCSFDEGFLLINSSLRDSATRP